MKLYQIIAVLRINAIRAVHEYKILRVSNNDLHLDSRERTVRTGKK